MLLKSIYILLLIPLNLGPIFSQQILTLDECIAYGLEHNLQLRDNQLNIASSEESYRQSYREFLPGASGSVGYGINFGRSTDPFSNYVVTTDFFSNTW